jgi:GT2 family glycosyltransferase
MKNEEDKTKLSIIVISYNTCKYTLNCIKSIYEATTDQLFEIILVDNASTDDTVRSVKRDFPEVQIIVNEKNLGYSAAVNVGAKTADGNFLILSNNDVIYHYNSINNLITGLRKYPRIGAAGPQQEYPNGNWQYCYGNLPGIILGLKKFFLVYHLELTFKSLLYNIIRHTQRKHVGYIDGAVMAIRKEAYTQVGGFDEDYFFYTEEADFCKRLKDNCWEVVFLPSATVMHLRGASSGEESVKQKNIEMLISSKVLFCKKHLSKATTKFYIRSEIFSTSLLMIFWTLLRFFSSGQTLKNASNKVLINKLILSEWRRNSRGLKPIK